jgi:ribosomal protein S18 acetylase RimI-like enzyme
MSDADVTIRPAREDDAEWIIPLGPRMHEFGPPPWRDVRVMDDAVAAQWARELASPTPGSAFLVAEDALGSPVGFVWLKTERDYFIDMPVGHVIDIAVTKAGEGRGIGRALLDAADRWAESNGYPWITLHVFEGNDRARRVYEKHGYVPEWTRMLKRIGPPARDQQSSSEPT